MSHHLPYIPDELLPIIRSKLHDFNQRRFPDKGYYIVLYPTAKSLYYTLWFYNPDAQHHPFIYLFNLELDALSSVRKAMRAIANSLLPLELKEEIDATSYQGDDIVLFGKYRGHHLQSIYLIDPRYINWIADKYEPKTKNEYRFKELAETYNRVFLDLQTKKRYKSTSSHFTGRPGDKIENLELTITKVRIEDDFYKTYLVDGVEYFYVDQLLTASDSAGNYFLLTIKAKDRSLASKTLSPGTHPYQNGEKIHIASAKVLKQIESHNTKYTKIGYIKFTGNQ
ncbi:hypothetical protein LJB97_03300 [Parabacteroides sp. OttesenSCG-928-O15]|nr:hypothetical protein [Parabacteroides sp. OttesenSCG-928-O15]